MRDLLEAFENLLISTSMQGSEAKDGADILLEAIHWSKRINSVEACDCPVVRDRLDEACNDCGGAGGLAESLAEALMNNRNALRWETPWAEYLDHPDMGALVQNFAYATIIGPGCALEAKDIYMGVSLQGPDLFYPMHAHRADELYWVVGGNGDWKVGLDPWRAVIPGDIRVHPSGVRHAMQTNAKPLLTVWAWWSHISSNIVMIRG